MANYARISIKFIAPLIAGEVISFGLFHKSSVTLEIEFFLRAASVRTSPDQFEIGSGIEDAAWNFYQAVMANKGTDPRLMIVIGMSDPATVDIFATEYDKSFLAYLYSPSFGSLEEYNKITVTVYEETFPAPEFSITDYIFQPPQTLPVCENQRVKLSVGNAVYPITINSAAGTKTAANDSELWVELPRYIPGEITLNDDTGATDSITPVSIAKNIISSIDVNEDISGASITINIELEYEVTPGGILNIQYSIDGTNYQNSNAFSGILPGSYTAYIRDSFNCIKTQLFTVEGLETPRPEPNFTIEKANPLRFVNAGQPEFKNVENTLYNEQENTNIEKYYFRQPFQSGSIVRTQIKTSYRNLVAKIYDCNNELTDEIIPEKKVTNIAKKDKRDCYLRGNAETGNFQIFFPGGNIYEPGTTDVINSYSSRGALPDFASTGILVSVDGESADLPAGTFEVIAIVYNEDVGYWTMEINAQFPLDSWVTYSATCESTFNAEIYDIFEFAFSKTNGQYRVEIEATDENSNYPDLLHVSEPIFFDELEKIVTIQYSSEDNQSGINYQTGIQFLLNIPGRLFNYSPGGEDESFTDDLGNKIIQKAVYVQQRELQTGLIPDWLAEKIVIASTHENFKINGLDLTMMDRPEVESKSENNNPLYVLTCIYQLKNKIVRDEQVGIVSSSRAVIGADAGAVLGV